MKAPLQVSAGVIAAGFALIGDAHAQVTWTVDVNGHGPPVSPTMHGVFFEDINYAGDGGLYAELIENRSFEHRAGMHAWTVEPRGGAEGRAELATDSPIHPNNPRYLHVEVSKPGGELVVANHGCGGIPVKQGGEYRLAIHARASKGYQGGLRVRIESPTGENLGEAAVSDLTENWMRHTAMITARETSAKARLVVLVDAAGTVDLDMVSLFPKDTWKGRENGMRADLVRLLAAMKPGFMRFPGGCIVEGNDLPNAYRWKDTVGPVWERKQNWNRWIQDDPNRPDHHYHQTYGLGFFEFFQLCEDIGAAPVPVLNCGMSCQFQAKQLVPLEELDEWVRDAIDLVEFANGPVTTKWGKLRADMGHPEPFGMRYLGIGNEQWGEEYFKRYEVFYKALKRECPEIVLITTSGPGVDDPNWKFAWDKFRSGTPAEVVDEHYYRPPQWFLEHEGRYDHYDRKGPKVFAGEYAAHRRDRANSLDAAICEAAFMTGLLRNADIVIMSCYAPLFAREGFVQWTPDMIWFDATRVMPTPTYHIQSMFAANLPDRMLPSELSNNSPRESLAGKAGVGTWLTQAEFRDVVVSSGGRTLFRSGDGMTGWDARNGEWSAAERVIRQTGSGERAVALIGDGSWKDYSISLKARKTGGSEGFLILFHTADENDFCWWNIGGWGNTAHALELRGTEMGRVPGRIETNRWYDIRVDVKGAEIICWLDKRQIHKVIRPLPRRIFASAGIDLEAGELILQAANPTADACDLLVRLKGWRSKGAARGQQLTGDGPDAINTLDQPDRVTPRAVKAPVEDGSIRLQVPAWSHTMLRVPK